MWLFFLSIFEQPKSLIMNSKHLLLTLFGLVLLANLYAQTATAPSLGDGSKENPYQIANLENLCWLSETDSIWEQGYYFIQTADIDASETKEWNEGEGFTPIGKFYTRFSGYYDGQGYEIDSLYVNKKSNGVGLFGYVEDSEIKNLGIENGNVSGDSYVGVLVGYNENCDLSECHCSGIVTGGSYAGILAGRDIKSTIKNCYSKGSISGSYYVGCLIGRTYYSIVNYCYSSGLLSGWQYSGGLIGYNERSEVSYCYSSCCVNGKYSAGGLVGYNYNHATISNCYNTGYVFAKNNVGGFVGRNGSNSNIAECYSTGFVSGDEPAGGLVGRNDQDAEIAECYYIRNESGRKNGIGYDENSQNVVCLSMEDMKQKSNFSSGWDFFGVWKIKNGSSFPYLKNMKNAPVFFCKTGYVIGNDNIDTITLVEMDTTVVSLRLTTKPTSMILDDNCIIRYSPAETGDTIVEISVMDHNGLTSPFSYHIQMTPFEGNGSETYPYQINSLTQLDSLSNNSDYWAYNFIQTADIDASATKDWNDGEGFSPIGDDSDWFTGSYDGSGHIINGIYINRPDEKELGCFGEIEDAEIRNLGIINSAVIGENYIGALVGHSMGSSSIVNSYTSGSVSGNYAIGGLVGLSSGSSTILGCYSSAIVNGVGMTGGLIGYNNSASVTNCYCTGGVSGYSKIGGLVGYSVNDASISCCYCTGLVRGALYTGGLVGYNTSSGGISDCYYNSKTSGQSNGIGYDAYSQIVVAVSTESMKQSNTYSSEWDFTETWELANGNSLPGLKDVLDMPVILINSSGFKHVNVLCSDTTHVIPMDAAINSVKLEEYPAGMTLNSDNIINWKPLLTGDTIIEIGIANENGLEYSYFYDYRISPFYGNGTEADPFQISSLADLDSLSQNSFYWSYYFLQTADIDASETADWNDGAGFSPIGNKTTKYIGNYNGAGYKIDSLTINHSEENNIGLFGFTDGAVIDSLFLADCTIEGQQYVGGIIGKCSSSSFSNCHCSGSVTGENWVGGCIGVGIQSSEIYNCHNACFVSADYCVGGVLGETSSSSIYYCFNTGTITGEDYVGGVIGYVSDSEAEKCYNSGFVSGEDKVGGLLGTNSASDVVNSYSTGWISGENKVGGLIGVNYNSTVSSCYSISNVYGLSNVGGFAGYSSESSTISDCYYASEITKDYPSLGYDDNGQEVTGLTTGEMMKQNNYSTEWDFTNVWDITDGITFPRLQNVLDLPMILPKTKGFYRVNTENTDTIHVVQMDALVDSVFLTIKPSGMSLEQDSIIKWIPAATGDTIVEIGIVDADGNASVFRYNILVSPFIGSGSESDPFLIRSLTDLDSLSSNSRYWYYDFEQTVDINAETTKEWNGGEGFSPIGNGRTYFVGRYNGNGHIINNLYINRSEQNYIGLFGYTEGAEIDSLGLTNCIVVGQSYTSGLVGNNSSTIISMCYNTGSVTGTYYTGGLIGKNYSNSEIANCYSACFVDGENRVGGIAGYNWTATISNCYSTGFVSGLERTGGFIGENNSKTVVSACYYNSENSGQSEGIGLDYNEQTVVGLTTAQMKESENYSSDWDFAATWDISNGATFPCLHPLMDGPIILQDFSNDFVIHAENTDTIHVVEMDAAIDSVYLLKKPKGMSLENGSIIKWTPTEGGVDTIIIAAKDENEFVSTFSYPISVFPFVGNGTEDDPYQIASLTDLRALSENTAFWSSYYIQTSDINASDTYNWNEGLGFSPIGNDTDYFTGCYNGDGHIIEGLYINRPDMNFIGLFGYCSKAYIDSLGLSNCTMYGYNYVGTLAGKITSSTEVSQCYSNSFVFDNGTVTGKGCIGGLVGENNASTIINTYSTGSVYGKYMVGGLVGRNTDSGNIITSYSIGSVSGKYYCGGFLGENSYSTISNCYFNKEISNCEDGIAYDYYSQNVIGLTTDEMKQSLSYEDWDFTNVWSIREGKTYPSLQAVDNAPFAFADSLIGSLSSLLDNDYDYETLQQNLIAKIDSVVSLVSGLDYSDYPEYIKNGDSLRIVYRAGEIRETQNDTLYGNQVISYLKVTGTGDKTTDVENVSSSDFSIFPNPVQKTFQVSGLNRISELYIYNLVGKRVYYKTSVSSGDDIDISNLPTGIYVLRIGNEEIKLVKQ